MKLYIIHGRKTPDENLEDWGANGPTLLGVKGTHQTYADRLRVIFKSIGDCIVAHNLTGWEKWDDDTLVMRWKEDLVVCTNSTTGLTMYYGDWGLMEDHDAT